MKMIKFMYLSTLCFLLCGTANGQRMLPGQKAIEMGFGLMSAQDGINDYTLQVGLTMQTGLGNYFLGSVGYLRQSAKYGKASIPLETYLAEGGYSLRLLGNFRRSVNVNASVVAVAGYERINKGDSLLFDGAVILNKSHLVYGLGGRISTEIYIADPLVLFLYGNTKVLWGTTRSQLRSSIGVGVRISL